MVKAIVFDKDGCLIDFDKTWGGWAEGLLSELACGDEAKLHDMAQAIGFRRASCSFDPTSPVIAGTSEEGPALLLPFLPNWTFDTLLSYANKNAALAQLYPVVPLPALMNDLSAMGLSLGVATNDAEATARSQLERLGIATAFDLILGADSGYGAKPESGMQRAFASHVGCPPSECIMVGDSLHDLHSGRAAGMICVGVLTGPAPREELAPAADVVLGDIGDLPGWIATR